MMKEKTERLKFGKYSGSSQHEVQSAIAVKEFQPTFCTALEQEPL
jgi:hypothetical protein